jgi:hypothetical protein
MWPDDFLLDVKKKMQQHAVFKLFYILKEPRKELTGQHWFLFAISGD